MYMYMHMYMHMCACLPGYGQSCTDSSCMVWLEGSATTSIQCGPACALK